MRNLASIQIISEISPIEGADAIEVASVQGWKAVVKKGEFFVGDKIVYLEIDSWVPHELAPFLSKGKEPREYEGVKGERLRSVKLRGQISQGLILPLGVIPQSYGCGFHIPVGDDVTELLGIKKWEPVIPAQLRGQVKGMFPIFLHKTDEERIQNLGDLLKKMVGIIFNAHEKLDGSSMTVYKQDGVFGVCSRNLDLTETADNSFWQVARKYNLSEIMPEGYCIQGELIGPGVQKNIYGLKELDIRVFNVFDIKNDRYLDESDAKMFTRKLGLPWVPYVLDFVITEDTTVDELLLMAEGKSALNSSVEREGLVWRPYWEREMKGLGRLSFKTISNKYLLEGGD